MKDLLSSVVDGYELKARILPPVLHTLPLLVLFAIEFAVGLDLTTITAGLLLYGLLFIGTSGLVRRWGKATESRLVGLWGGLPTTKMLRHGDATLNEHTKARYHTKLVQLVPGLVLPTAESERSNPANADRVYSSAVEFVRDRTRQKEQFGLVFRELGNYGFARNFRATKPVGLVVAFAILLGEIVVLTCKGMPAWMPDCTWLISSFAPSAWHAAAALALAQAGILFLAINDEFVSEAAESYARALLGSLEAVEIDHTPVVRAG